VQPATGLEPNGRAERDWDAIRRDATFGNEIENLRRNSGSGETLQPSRLSRLRAQDHRRQSRSNSWLTVSADSDVSLR
jgi:hypothetical protein